MQQFVLHFVLLGEPFNEGEVDVQQSQHGGSQQAVPQCGDGCGPGAPRAPRGVCPGGSPAAGARPGRPAGSGAGSGRARLIGWARRGASCPYIRPVQSHGRVEFVHHTLKPGPNRHVYHGRDPEMGAGGVGFRSRGWELKARTPAALGPGLERRRAGCRHGPGTSSRPLRTGEPARRSSAGQPARHAYGSE